MQQDEIHLNNFIIFRNRVQCLKEGNLNLNGIQANCKSLQIFKLEKEFIITSEGKKMSNYHIRSSKRQRLSWGEDYEFSNLPVTYLTDFGQDDSVLSPILYTLLLTPAGQVDFSKSSSY